MMDSIRDIDEFNLLRDTSDSIGNIVNALHENPGYIFSYHDKNSQVRDDLLDISQKIYSLGKF